MSRKTRRIFIATALGTMLGLYTSIYFLPELVWWIGALAGGVGAGFIYALPDIIHYSPNAFQIAKNDLRKTGRILPAIFESIQKMPGSKKWNYLAIIVFFGLFFVWIFSVFYFSADKIFTPIFVGGFCYIMFNTCLINWAMNMSFPKDSEVEKIRRAKKSIILMSPPGFVFLIIYGAIKIAPKLAGLLFMVLSDLLRLLAVFFKTLFILVHSRELLLCSVDAAMGVLIFYPLLISTGNLQTGPGLIFGGLTGGLIGVLHYKLVSVRLLRVNR